MREADRQVSPSVDVMKIIHVKRELEAGYLQALREQYGVTEEQELDIRVEGLQEGWALE